MPSRASSIERAAVPLRSLEPTPWQLPADERRESSALERLLLRCLPSIRRWAHGRLPRWARTAADTSDIVQDAVLRTFRRLDVFEPRSQRALAAYLRQAVRNRICDEHRRLRRWGAPEMLPDAPVDAAPSPLDAAITSENETRYRTALASLPPPDQEIIVGHVELGYTHEQLGCMTGRSSHAARMALRRAVDRLVESMRGR